MTCHSIRIKTSTDQADNPGFVPKPEPPALENVLPERVNEHIKYNFNPVVEDQDSPMSKRLADDLTGRPEHVSGTYRFDASDDKKSLLDSIEQKVGADCKWYKVESHDICDHDHSPNAEIVSATPSKSEIIVNGDETSYFNKVMRCRINYSTKTVFYKLSNVSYDSQNDQTTIIVDGQLEDVEEDRYKNIVGVGCGYFNDQGKFVNGWKTERTKGNVPEGV